jgi:succinoglycan biosynthesis protein ExoW
MRKVAVVIPYYQREPGVLVRALASVAAQRLPDSWWAEVLVIDDGSPCPAADEVWHPRPGAGVQVRVVRQDHQGVAAARNRGLDLSDGATLVAFLDSDDAWPVDHLERAVRAFECGIDLYFTDNRRPGHHDSHVRSHCAPETGRFLAAAPVRDGLALVPTDTLVRLVLEELPTQASTVVYRREAAPHLRFDTRLRSAGEDVLFFAGLAGVAARAAFDTESCVVCGGGLNMYYAHLSWDSPMYLAIKLDQYRAHQAVARSVPLSPANRAWNAAHVVHCRRVHAFHLARQLVRHPARLPRAVWRLLRTTPAAALLLPLDLVHVAVRPPGDRPGAY